MKFLHKLPNSRREPPGLEWVFLKKLPMVLVGGTLVPLLVSLGSRLYPPSGTSVEIAKQLRGEAGERQVPNADVGLKHNVGGIGQYTFVQVMRRD